MNGDLSNSSLNKNTKIRNIYRCFSDKSKLYTSKSNASFFERSS
ncbi:hypothetical protein LEP1GSC047_4223 [Leptospira inadai serovar Lyme str. 10]|uniref:Uncharacterized protein n=1 Tax=Leptospira inadai serovar Lyme str. 10 TaxID=1049790 RepID=V6HDG3_9LEPT|nr:hypothetical protein LEP1GSC047_4223 [Leptospira inadai serovar Lyme str. 10]